MEDATSNLFKIGFAIFAYMNALLSIRLVTFKTCKIFVSYAIKFQFCSVKWNNLLYQMPLANK